MAIFTQTDNQINISVKANANSAKEKIFIKSEQLYIYFKAARENGKANEKLIEILSEFLDVPKSKIAFLSGKTSTQKIIGIHQLDNKQIKAISTKLLNLRDNP